MSKRLDVVMSTKDKSGKARFTKVGVVFIADDGRMSLVVDPGVSISTPPGTFCNLLLPREKQADGTPVSARSGGQKFSQDSDEESDLPF